MACWIISTRRRYRLSIIVKMIRQQRLAEWKLNYSRGSLAFTWRLRCSLLFNFLDRRPERGFAPTKTVVTVRYGQGTQGGAEAGATMHSPKHFVPILQLDKLIAECNRVTQNSTWCGCATLAYWTDDEIRSSHNRLCKFLYIQFMCSVIIARWNISTARCWSDQDTQNACTHVCYSDADYEICWTP